MKQLWKLAVLIVMSMVLAGCTKYSYDSKICHTSVKKVLQSWEHRTKRLEREERQQMTADSLLEETAAIPTPYHILLIGTDRRSSSWNGNADSIMLLSVNPVQKKIALISFMRDLGVNIPGRGYGKINSSYAIGGRDLLKATIEENFQIPIHNCVAVDFAGMAKLVDMVGGVTITVSEAEIPVINGYIKEMCQLQKLDPQSYFLSTAGTIHMNGMQAVGYCRNRYVGNCDFERTARQRRVLEQMMVQAKQMSAVQLLRFSAQAVSLLQHDLSSEQITQLAALAASLDGYQLVMDRIPYDGLYQFNQENLDPVWPETVARLHATIY